MIAPLPYAELCSTAYGVTPDIMAGPVARAIVRDTLDGRALIFAGTRPEHIADDLADLDIGPTHIVGIGDVHEGFWGAMIDIAPKAFDIEATILSGHSLGGAIALDLAAFLCISGIPPQNVITFGAPRVGIGPAIRNLFERHGVNIQMYCNASDPVPHMPPQIEPFVDWQHPGELIKIGEDGTTSITDVLSVFKKIEVAHSISCYIESLQ